MKTAFGLRTLTTACLLFSATQSIAAEFNQRLANLSTRAQVGVGGNVATVGFVIGAGSPKNILIRAVGPSLGAAPFNVPGVNSDPQIAIFNSGGVRIASNDNWGTPVAPIATTSAQLTAAFTSVGAFAFSSTTSKDAAILASNLGPGNYTAQVSGVGTTNGVALVEIYDMTGSARLMNLSTSAQVGSGAGVLISGLSIPPGGGARKILIRAAGPQLSLPVSQGGFGVVGAISDPAIAVFDNAGQDCCARSRLLVQRSVYDKFMEKFEVAVKNFRVEDPSLETSEMGPLISAGQLARVKEFIPDGSNIAFQGSKPSGPGFWFAPTVLTPKDTNDRAYREEIFGPVVSVLPFEDESDAIRIANDSEYGLSGSIWSRDIGQAIRVSRAVEAGNLSVNSNSSVRYWTPFGGYKQSGLGRELGPDALDAFTETKNVFFDTQS
jgi:hypothetical protein